MDSIKNEIGTKKIGSIFGEKSSVENIIRDPSLDKNFIKKYTIENFVKGEILAKNRTSSASEDVAPSGSALGVRLEEHVSTNLSIAGYNAIENRIVLYPLILFGSPEAKVVNAHIETVMRHEKSHAVFSCLSKQDQSRVTDIFLQHKSLLADAYRELRNFGYSAGYFIVDAGDINYSMKVRELGRCVKAEKSTIFEISQGEKQVQEKVNAAIVVMEILGWIQDSRVDPEAGSPYRDSKVARAFLQAFTPEENHILNELGLLEVDVSDLMNELQQDSKFVKYREQTRERAARIKFLLEASAKNIQKKL